MFSGRQGIQEPHFVPSPIDLSLDLFFPNLTFFQSPGQIFVIVLEFMYILTKKYFSYHT